VDKITNIDLTGSGPHNIQYVGIGEIRLGKSGEFLRISALGSCIGLIIYPNDDKEHFAVMAHIMLPSSDSHAHRKKSQKSIWPMSRFADIAVPIMIKELTKSTGRKRRNDFESKMIGGAELFGGTRFTFRIGKENAETTKLLLKRYEIPLIKEFTGGDTGMSVDFDVSTYELKIKPTGGVSIVI